MGASYDQKNGVASLWINSKRVAQTRIGRIRIATNYPVRLGARISDKRYFKGRIACLQIFSVPLSSVEIARRKKKCFRGRNLIPT